MMPSNRTLLKFGRGLLFAAGSAALLFANDHYTEIGLPPTAYPFIVPVIALGYRWVRGAQGNEPTA